MRATADLGIAEFQIVFEPGDRVLAWHRAC
jgi:hypothetical protein